jgi:hypothetical protein
MMLTLVLVLACGPKPQDAVLAHLAAKSETRLADAYGYFCESDRAAVTVEKYQSGMQPEALAALPLTTYAVLGTTRAGDNSVVQVRITAPHYEPDWDRAFDSWLENVLVGPTLLDVRREFAVRVSAGDFEQRATDVEFVARMESGAWCVFADFVNKIAASQLVVEALRLSESHDYELAMKKVAEAEELGAKDAEDHVAYARDTIKEDQRAWEEQEGYRQSVVVRNTKVTKACRKCRNKVEGEVKNGGDRTLSYLKLRIYGLDDAGTPVFDEIATPVWTEMPPSLIRIDDEDWEPLKSNYSRGFYVYAPDPPPSDWNGSFRVEVDSLQLF